MGMKFCREREAKMVNHRLKMQKLFLIICWLIKIK